MDASLTKAERTRKFIIEKSAPIFNKKGFAGTSMTDIMAATGLTKGGIYGNFQSKDEIALASFDFYVDKMFGNTRKVIKKKDNAIDKLNVALSYHKNILYDPDSSFGCPILNTAIEADDTHPQLRQKVFRALEFWREGLTTILANGIKHKQIKTTVRPALYADLFISLIEGAVMQSKISNDKRHIQNCYDRIQLVIENELVI